MHGQRIGCVAVTTLFFVVLRLFVEPVVQKIKLVVVGIVGNGHKVLEHLGYAVLDKRVIARLLYFYKVGNVYNLVNFTELSSLGFAILLNG